MVFDELRDRVVLFTGSETWEWDAGTWSQRATTGPSSRSGHGMAYDAARAVVVLFGGLSGSTRYADTWEWDGTSWTERTVSGPSPRADHAMSYDLDRGVTTLFGGSTASSTYSQETWEWDGVAWLRRSASGPPGNSGKNMTYDAARGLTVLLNTIGGQTNSWEWNGTAWTQGNTSGPSATLLALTYDRRRESALVCYGNQGTMPEGNELWHWNGVDWHQVAGTPTARNHTAVAYDSNRDRILMFGGSWGAGFSGFNLGDGWTWNGGAWLPVSAIGPSARFAHAMVYDSVRDVVVLFGGAIWVGGGSRNWYGDTWEWDGGAWVGRSVTGPSPRSYCAAAFDSLRGVVVLFGGERPGYTYTGETWEWNGANWSNRLVSGPAARAGASMCFDANRGVCVLFGGFSGSTPYFGDTWEWDGQAWTQRQVSGPSPRVDAAMAYDSVRGSSFLFGGWRQNGPSAETWEWNGSVWTQHLVNGPSARELSSNAMCFDSARGRFIVYGGWTGTTNVPNETWSLQTSCIGPILHTQPEHQRVCAGSTLTLSVAASGTEPLAYQWRRNSDALADEPDHISGSGTPMLTIRNASASDAGSYDCVVTNCETATSDAATLSVCDHVGDLNCDGQVGIADLAVLLSNFGRIDEPSYTDGDLNADGAIGLPDLAILLAEFGAACP